MSETESTPGVEYRLVEGYPDYRVGDDGTLWSQRVRRSRKGLHGSEWVRSEWHQIHGSKHPRGYIVVTLCDGPRRTIHLTLNRLVLLTFRGPPQNGRYQAAHNNGIPTDNRLENLRWATPKENARDRDQHGTMLYGTRNPAAKLTPDQVREIRRLYATGDFTQDEIATQFGISQHGIYEIVRGKRWKHVA